MAGERLTARAAIVTGGADGIRRATATRYAAEAAAVLVADFEKLKSMDASVSFRKKNGPDFQFAGEIEARADARRARTTPEAHITMITMNGFTCRTPVMGNRCEDPTSRRVM